MVKKASDKRKNPRRVYGVDVDSKEGTLFEGSRTLDISKGGAGLVVKNYVPVNTQMAVEIDLSPSGEPILALGQVKWITQVPEDNSYRLGLAFSDVERRSQNRLGRFVK